MRRTFPYDTRRTPPAPVLPVRLGRPQGEPAAAVAALVDSGADITVLPEGLARVLGLPQVSEVTVRGVAGTARVPVYAAELEAAGTRRIVEVVEVGAEALLGRDVLNGWVVTLDGPARVLRLGP
ncbi:MAG: retroviral-like aspartic protease family protein [Armatimonadota bacterium]|nr:retroviral-like aspartic protease family protein [Armatimonadota bacterium]MDR7438238.1 retroviral-like aspartic protease family protein [Armatimonadota bacterium]MDR7510381.1 retroviral-like aspartic protease family protein [Armatimonadota bacterium]MDR7583309.1 retroviral-like aspartic protease family protein [Armatimonadota bacterium]